jgi:hypothetical protein
MSVDHPTIANVSGTAVRDRDAPIRDFFQKIESDFAAQGRQGRFLSAAPCLLLRAKVSASREFFAV